MKKKFLNSMISALLASATGCAIAQDVTRIVVAFAPGGPQDVVARILAGPLGKELHTQVIVENRPGANGALAANAVARAIPDGHTLWFTSVGATVINKFLYEKLSYDMTRDFVAVSLVANNAQLIVVQASDSAKTAADLVAQSKVSPLPLAMASSGIGSVPHLTIEQIAHGTGARFIHTPYRGTALGITDLMGGQIRGLVADTSGLVSYVNGGKLKAIGISAPHRSPAFPNVPTLTELGMPKVDGNNWYGVFAAAKTPTATVAQINAALRKTLEQPAVREQLIKIGSEPAYSTSAELSALVQSDSERWGKLIKDASIRAESTP